MTLRRLVCPICEAVVKVPVHDELLPEVHKLPEHAPANGSNLCQAVIVTVILNYDHCSQCGCKCSKHQSGMCRKCFGDVLESTN
mgnify:CR=1 FL=1